MRCLPVTPEILFAVGEVGFDLGTSLPRVVEVPASTGSMETVTLSGPGVSDADVGVDSSYCGARGVSGLADGGRGTDADVDGIGGTSSGSGEGEVTMFGGRGDEPGLDFGPFRLNPLPPNLPPGDSLPLLSARLAERDGSCDELVAAVRVSIGGGRMGVATREEEVEEVVRDEEVEAFRWMEGDVGSRGKTGYGGVGGAEVEGVGIGETGIAVAMVDLIARC